jgi:signal transduction histidine kinase
MVAKVDREEIYAPLRRQTLSALAVLGALLTGGALLMGLLWRRRSAELLGLALAEREAHEQERQRMNRLYAALSQVNGAVVRARSREELLQAICRVLVRFGGAQMAWVGWVDHTTMRVLPLARQGDDGGYLQRVQVFADERPEGRGPVGTAIREGHPCVCANIAEDPRMAPWREAAARSGWRSMAAFPIRQEEEIRGALAVYAGQSDFFGPQEQALLEEAAADVSFGLDVLLNEQRRKQAEDDLARANAVLEDKVRERTAQLVDANANLQAFAHTSAHDLRSPLRAIRSFSGLLLEDYGAALGADGRSMLARVTASADQMAQLLDDLLEYSRMNQAQVRLEPVELDKAVSEALALLEGDIRAKNAVVSVAQSLPDVTGHLATLVVVINNLVSNALKFMPAGVQPQVRISAEQTGSTVRLWVEDNGIGITPTNQEKIFGAFERLHRRQQYPGTGLGLAIVRKGAERMGGQVGVESELEKGSRFWVELKAAERPVESSPFSRPPPV